MVGDARAERLLHTSRDLLSARWTLWWLQLCESSARDLQGIPSRAGRFSVNHSHGVAAAGSRRPASARMQMSRSDSRAARLDEDDETESSTRFRSDSLRLRKRDLVDALSGRQEGDEEVEAALSLC